MPFPFISTSASSVWLALKLLPLLMSFWPWTGPAAHILGDEFHQRLLNGLFHHYDRRIQPNEAQHITHPVRINVTIVLGILIEMRENEQVAAYVISHTQRWRDKRLAWSPTQHGNVTELIVPAKAIWQPKIFVYNSMDTKDMLSDDKFDARLRHTGEVKVNIPQYVTCTCRLGIELFPFDTQFCAVALASPLLTIDEMEVHSNQPPNESYFAGNSEWNLINVSVRDMHYLEEGEYRSEVHYVFHLRRRPIFYIIVIVVPIFLISALSILGIFTPGSNDGPRSEKVRIEEPVSLGLGSLLAMTVLLGIVAGAMPKSNSIPLLGYYILSVILLCAVAVAISMAFMTASKRYVDNAQVPSQLTYRISLVRPRLKNAARRIERAAGAGGNGGGEAGGGIGKERLGRRKSLGEQLMGIRFTEFYQEPDQPAEEEENSKDKVWRRQMNYGSMGEGRTAMEPIGEGGERQQNGTAGVRLRVPNGDAEGAGGRGGTTTAMRRLTTGAGETLTAGDRLSLELSLIRSMLAFVADSQRIFRTKLKREETREKIEREWARVFMKLDYVCLAVFQLLNLFSLLFFLKFAWADSPREPDRPLV